MFTGLQQVNINFTNLQASFPLSLQDTLQQKPPSLLMSTLSHFPTKYLISLFKQQL